MKPNGMGLRISQTIHNDGNFLAMLCCQDIVQERCLSRPQISCEPEVSRCFPVSLVSEHFGEFVNTSDYCYGNFGGRLFFYGFLTCFNQVGRGLII